MKNVNYEKVVSELNQQLNEKYQVKELRNLNPMFQSEELRTYFTLGFDNYKRELIYFSDMIVYSSMINTMEDHSEDEVKKETVFAFNMYIDSLGYLKL
jgi:hypothetical protein